MITYISRCGICAAWSFNALEETCTLHTTDACCGQLDKRRANSDFVSGYICPQCSSTRNDCPCPRRIRQLGTLGCHIAQSAGKSPIYTSTAVSLTKIPNWKGAVRLAHVLYTPLVPFRVPNKDFFRNFAWTFPMRTWGSQLSKIFHTHCGKYLPK